MTVELKAPRRKTLNALFALSGNRCAFPDCSQVFYDPSTRGVVGDVAHIHGKNPGSARYRADLTSEQVHELDNLVVLCKRHHQLVDQVEPDSYPAELIREFKRTLEEGGIQAPPELTVQALRAYLENENRTAEVLEAGLDTLSDAIRSGLDLQLMRDLPVLTLSATGGRLMASHFQPEWKVRHSGGAGVGSVQYRFVSQRLKPQKDWSRAVINQDAVSLCRGDVNLVGPPVAIDEWDSLGPDDLGLEVAFQYAGFWWLRRFRVPGSLAGGKFQEVGSIEESIPIRLPANMWPYIP